MQILLLDLDHTLYPSTLPTLGEIDARIADYIHHHLNLDPSQSDQKRQELCGKYGTTLRGLMLEHGVDPRHYCEYVHAIAEEFMPPADPILRAWIQQVPHPIYVFTNAPRDWAERCLKALGLHDLLQQEASEAALPLQGILDLSFLDWKGKPYSSAFEQVESFIRKQHKSARQFHLADDRLDNLATAKNQGWGTLWVRPHNAIVEGDFDAVVSRLVDLNPVTLRQYA